MKNGTLHVTHTTLSVKTDASNQKHASTLSAAFQSGTDQRTVSVLRTPGTSGIIQNKSCIGMK